MQTKACEIRNDGKRPLTHEELRWIKRLSRVLLDCPERFDLLTHGYRHMEVIEREGAKHSDLCDGAALRDGLVRASLLTPCIVHGVSG